MEEFIKRNLCSCFVQNADLCAANTEKTWLDIPLMMRNQNNHMISSFL